MLKFSKGSGSTDLVCLTSHSQVQFVTPDGQTPQTDQLHLSSLRARHFETVKLKSSIFFQKRLDIDYCPPKVTTGCKVSEIFDFMGALGGGRERF